MVGVGDTAATVAVVVAIGTYWHTSTREKALRRAELMHSFSSEFSGDAQLVDLFTDIDYGRFSFVADPDAWLGHDPEKQLVRLLDLYNSVGHNCHRRVLTVRDVHGTTLGYGVLRAYQDLHVREYLAYVDQFDADHLGTGAAFEYFRRLALKLERTSHRARARRVRQLKHSQWLHVTRPVPPAMPALAPDSKVEDREPGTAPGQSNGPLSR